MRTVHLVNRLLAVLLSLAVIAGAVLLAVEVIRWAVGESPWVVPYDSWWDELRTVEAGDDVVLAIAAGVALVGLLLLWFELVPRAPKALPAAPLADRVDTVVTRSGIRTVAENAARNVSGIRAASASVGRRKVSVRARTRGRGLRRELEPQVRQEVESALADLRLTRSLAVRARVEEDD